MRSQSLANVAGTTCAQYYKTLSAMSNMNFVYH